MIKLETPSCEHCHIQVEGYFSEHEDVSCPICGRVIRAAIPCGPSPLAKAFAAIKALDAYFRENIRKVGP